MPIPASMIAAFAPDTLASRAGAPPAPKKLVRRLPVQRVWPSWLIVAVQVGIMVAVIGYWELAAELGWIDGFFWSRPTLIWETLTAFFGSGTAGVDIAFTFRSTLMGFAVGTVGGSLLGLSFWWS